MKKEITNIYTVRRLLHFWNSSGRHRRRTISRLWVYSSVLTEWAVSACWHFPADN